MVWGFSGRICVQRFAERTFKGFSTDKTDGDAMHFTRTSVSTMKLNLLNGMNSPMKNNGLVSVSGRSVCMYRQQQQLVLRFSDEKYIAAFAFGVVFVDLQLCSWRSWRSWLGRHTHTFCVPFAAMQN